MHIHYYHISPECPPHTPQTLEHSIEWKLVLYISNFVYSWLHILSPHMHIHYYHISQECPPHTPETLEKSIEQKLVLYISNAVYSWAYIPSPYMPIHHYHTSPGLVSNGRSCFTVDYVSRVDCVSTLYWQHLVLTTPAELHSYLMLGSSSSRVDQMGNWLHREGSCWFRNIPRIFQDV